MTNNSINPEEGKNLTSIIDSMVKDVSPVNYKSDEDGEVDADAIAAARKELLNGGFGDMTVEKPDEKVLTMVDRFSSKEPKNLYQMIIDKALLKDNGTEYELDGIFCEETGIYNVLDCGISNKKGLVVSQEHFLKMLNPSAEINDYDFFGTYINNGWVFHKNDSSRTHITVRERDMKASAFSRLSGLIEVPIMENKTAIIVGCGSVGSFVALELARAGVGNFVLIDGDTLEIHNICRHQLGLRDLGRYKVDAVKDAIHNINPSAKVSTFRGYLKDIPCELISDVKDGIVIGTGDNRESSALANEVAEILNVPFVETGCWQRAHAGECFYWYPGSGLPLYRSAFEKLISDERPASHQHYFANDDDEKNLRFEPGISTDIEFVSIIAVKIVKSLTHLNPPSSSSAERRYEPKPA